MEGNSLVCPRCKHYFASRSEHIFRCDLCDLEYPVRFGIPDLRYPRPVVVDSESRKIRQLANHFETSSYDDLLKRFLSLPDFNHLPPEVIERVYMHRKNQLQRGTAFTKMFLAKLQSHFTLPNTEQALEIGCGAGAGLVSLSKIYNQVVGLDPDLPNLLLARKFCIEYGVVNFQLVQAYGQFLPYQSSQFTYVTAQNVLEHVFDVDEVTHEIARVLIAEGCFTADSRNRYDLLFPEPHVEVRWVGLLPRRWATDYVRWRTGLDYSEMHTHLLSYGDLEHALVQAFGDSWRIVVPDVNAYGFPSSVDTLLSRIGMIAPLNAIFTRFFPSHLVLAQENSLIPTEERLLSSAN